VLRVIMLNNNIKILLVSFVHHIKLQNFLNAPIRYMRIPYKYYTIKLIIYYVKHMNLQIACADSVS